jgi:aminoglycoside 6'-N-acetyltransferase I
MTQVQIRRAGPHDACLFERVAENVFDAPINAAALADFLSAANHLMVVALASGQVIGQARAIIHFNPDEGAQLYIDNLGVSPAMQRRRIGRRLVQELFDWGVERGCRGAWVATESDNVAAIGLYQHIGAHRQDMVYFEYPLQEHHSQPAA